MRKRVQYLVLAASLLSVPLSFTTGCAVTRGRESVGNYTGDRGTTAQIKTALLGDPVVKGTQVDVTTYKGVVQLSGFVETQAQKDRAGQLAQDVAGRNNVHNDLIVMP